MQACNALAPVACTHRGSESSLEGRVFAGRYRLGQVIGAGAMGRVFAAEHIDLGRACAVKVIRGEGEGEHFDPRAREEAVARFHTEALAASRMDHPNVLRVLDFGREPDGVHYLVSEQLDGIDLVDLVAQEERLSLIRAAKIVRQVCSALQHAHDRGVVHRDVKPENVRVVRREGDDGNVSEVVKLLDFGTAFIADGEATSGRLVIGTPAYMSPEQASGEPVDARADLYAVGVLLFELVTGRLPFERSSAVALAAAHIECPPPAPSSLDERITPDLERIILACLAKEPAMRPQSARALRHLLDRWIAERAPEEMPRWSEPEIIVDLEPAPAPRARVFRLRPRAVAAIAAAAIGAAAAIALHVGPFSLETADAAELPPRPAVTAVVAAAHVEDRAAGRPTTVTPSATAAEVATPQRVETSAAPRHLGPPKPASASDATARAIAEPPPDVAPQKIDALTIPAPPIPEPTAAATTTSSDERAEATSSASTPSPRPYAPEGI